MRLDSTSRLEDLAPELVERLDEMCDRFEAEWKAGHRPRIENYLSEVTGMSTCRVAARTAGAGTGLASAPGRAADTEGVPRTVPG